MKDYLKSNLKYKIRAKNKITLFVYTPIGNKLLGNSFDYGEIVRIYKSKKEINKSKEILLIGFV